MGRWSWPSTSQGLMTFQPLGEKIHNQKRGCRTRAPSLMDHRALTAALDGLERHGKRIQNARIEGMIKAFRRTQ